MYLKKYSENIWFYRYDIVTDNKHWNSIFAGPKLPKADPGLPLVAAF